MNSKWFFYKQPQFPGSKWKKNQLYLQHPIFLYNQSTNQPADGENTRRVKYRTSWLVSWQTTSCWCLKRTSLWFSVSWSWKVDSLYYFIIFSIFKVVSAFPDLLLQPFSGEQLQEYWAGFKLKKVITIVGKIFWFHYHFPPWGSNCSILRSFYSQARWPLKR